MGGGKPGPKRTPRQTAADEGLAAIHDLELKLQGNIHDIDLIGKDEDIRRVEMRHLALRDENSTLKSRLSEAERTNENLHSRCAELQSHVDQLQKHAHEHETNSRSRKKEIANLQAELSGINQAMRDSNSMTEKYHAASAELTKLRPEVDHLRAQMTDYQDLITTRLRLERSLNQAEVELESEKRAASRARGKATQKAEEELRDRISDLESQLASEKNRRNDRAKADFVEASNRAGHLQAELDAATNQLNMTKMELKQAEETIKSLEKNVASQDSKAQARLGDMNEDLRDAQDQLKRAMAEIKNLKHSDEEMTERLKAKLKETRSGLNLTRAELKTQKASAGEPVLVKNVPARPAQTKGKGAVSEVMAEQTTLLDSPEPVKRPNKKRPLDLVARKSNFSVTPFLNRTKEVEEVIDEDGELEDSVLHNPKGSPNDLSKPSEISDAEEHQLQDSEAQDVLRTKHKRTHKNRAASTTREPKKRGRKPTKPAVAEPASAKNNFTNSTKKEAKGGKNPTVSFSVDKVMDGADHEKEEEEEEEEEYGADKVVPKEDALPVLVKGILKKSAPAEFGQSSTDTVTLETLDKELDGKRKKRKLVGGVGKTLFDEDDGEGMPTPAQAKRAAGKVKRLPAKAGVVKARLKPAFSPLKKDRRGGVQHSFLQ